MGLQMVNLKSHIRELKRQVKSWLSVHWDLIHQPDVLEEVKEEFAQFKESRPFQSMLLDNAKPH